VISVSHLLDGEFFLTPLELLALERLDLRAAVRNRVITQRYDDTEMSLSIDTHIDTTRYTILDLRHDTESVRLLYTSLLIDVTLYRYTHRHN